jgi:hypothetical protein
MNDDICLRYYLLFILCPYVCMWHETTVGSMLDRYKWEDEVAQMPNCLL